MGSRIGTRGRLLDDVLWLDPIEIVAGHLTRLALPRGSRLSALGVMLLNALKLKLSLVIAGFDARFHAYDWRLGVETLAAELNARIEADGLRDVMLVGHSMGGVVARVALAAGAGRIVRVVQLGAPNGGSFAAVLALRGVYVTVRKLAALDLRHDAEDLARLVFRSLPSLHELLGSIVDANARALVLGVFRNVDPSGAAAAVDARLGGAVREFTLRRMLSGRLGEAFVLPCARSQLLAEFVLFVGLGDFPDFGASPHMFAAENAVRTLTRARAEDFATVLFGTGSGMPVAAALERHAPRRILAALRGDDDHVVRRITICETNPRRYASIRRALPRVLKDLAGEDVEVVLDETAPATTGAGAGAGATMPGLSDGASRTAVAAPVTGAIAGQGRRDMPTPLTLPLPPRRTTRSTCSSHLPNTGAVTTSARARC